MQLISAHAPIPSAGQYPHTHVLLQPIHLSKGSSMLMQYPSRSQRWYRSRPDQVSTRTRRSTLQTDGTGGKRVGAYQGLALHPHVRALTHVAKNSLMEVTLLYAHAVWERRTLSNRSPRRLAD